MNKNVENFELHKIKKIIAKPDSKSLDFKVLRKGFNNPDQGFLGFVLYFLSLRQGGILVNIKKVQF